MATDKNLSTQPKNLVQIMEKLGPVGAKSPEDFSKKVFEYATKNSIKDTFGHPIDIEKSLRCVKAFARTIKGKLNKTTQKIEYRGERWAKLEIVQNENEFKIIPKKGYTNKV